MPQPDTWYAYFHLRGSFDPHELTRELGVAPTESAREGEPVGDGIAKRPCSHWALYSRLEKSTALNLQVRDILDQLDSNTSAFQRLSREFDGTIELVGYFHEYEPGVALERDLIARMASYGLALDCDFYSCR